MSENLWARFDGIASPEDVEEAKAQFVPVEPGKYRVTIEQLVAGESTSENSKGLPMLKGRFRIIEDNKVIFYNQLLQNISYPDLGIKNIAEVVELVNGILGEDIPFTNLGALAELISEIPIGTECVVEVFYGSRDVKKQFVKLRIADDSEVPEVEGFQPTSDDIPF